MAIPLHNTLHDLTRGHSNPRASPSQPTHKRFRDRRIFARFLAVFGTLYSKIRPNGPDKLIHISVGVNFTEEIDGGIPQHRSTLNKRLDRSSRVFSGDTLVGVKSTD